MPARRSHNPAALVVLALLVAFMFGLSPGPATAQPPIEPPNPIIDAAIADLGQRLARTLARGLNVQFDWTWQEFPDASLGCPQPGQTYATVITPGYIIQLSVSGARYDYRASQDGAALFLCGLLDAQGTPQPPTSGPSTPALSESPQATPQVIPPLPTLTPTSQAVEAALYDPALAYIGPDGNVYVTALGEGPGTPLTGDANRHSTPEFPFYAEDRDYGLLRWSPDGTRLLFVDQKDGTLYLAISDQAPAVVARGLENGMPASWSPDGAEFAIAVPTDVAADAGAHMVQVQAFPSDGGAPRYAGEFAFGGCSSQIDDPTWALYQDETGPAGGRSVFVWTAAGFVHSLGCGGQGLALTSFENVDLWRMDDVERPTISPDGASAAAIQPGVEGSPPGLVLIDLVTGESAALDTQGNAPGQLAWSADGTSVLFSVAAPATIANGSADSAVGASMFPIWPLTARTNSLALWQVPAGGGQAQSITPDVPGFGIGNITASPDDDIVLFSVVSSSQPMIELINEGADAAAALAAAPQVSIWFVELPGGFSQLQAGGQPAFGGAFSAVPAFVVDAVKADAQAVVCEGALPARLAVGGSGRALPAANVNLRESANSGASRVDVIPAGASFDVVGGPSCDSGILWWQVDYRGRRGWAAESLDGSYLLSPQS